MFVPFSYQFPKANAFMHSHETSHLSANQLTLLDDALAEAYKLYSYYSLNYFGFTEGIAFAFEISGLHIRNLIEEIYDEERRKEEAEYD